MPRFLLIICALSFIPLTVFPHVFADSVTIDDQAKVLDASQVQTEATKLPYAMLVYTTKTFDGDQNALDQTTRDRLPGQDAVGIGLDVTRRHLSIQSGANVPLSDSQASDAVDAFRAHFNNGDYTGATIAAIDSLLNTFGADENTGSNSGVGTTDNGTTFPDNGVTNPQIDTSDTDNSGIVIGAIVVIGIVFFFSLASGLVQGVETYRKMTTRLMTSIRVARAAGISLAVCFPPVSLKRASIITTPKVPLFPQTTLAVP